MDNERVHITVAPQFQGGAGTHGHVLDVNVMRPFKLSNQNVE